MGENDINLIDFHKSIGNELNAIKDRVRHLIGDAHWGEEGRYKEAILRNSIIKFLPIQYSLGTGFVLIKDLDKAVVTSQIDIIVYDNSYPTLFKEGGFVIFLPQSVRGIIEVKTEISLSKFSKALEKINYNAQMIYEKQKGTKDLSSIRTTVSKADHRLFIGLFSYDYNGNKEEYLTKIKKLFNKKEDNDELDFDDKCRCFINHISLSDKIFLNFFPNPYGNIEYTGWTVNEGLSKAFFITQLLWYLEPLSAYENSEVWTSPCKLRTFKKIVLKER